jgi:hypothetical protein
VIPVSATSKKQAGGAYLALVISGVIPSHRHLRKDCPVSESVDKIHANVGRLGQVAERNCQCLKDVQAKHLSRMDARSQGGATMPGGGGAPAGGGATGVGAGVAAPMQVAGLGVAAQMQAAGAVALMQPGGLGVAAPMQAAGPAAPMVARFPQLSLQVPAAAQSGGAVSYRSKLIQKPRFPLTRPAAAQGPQNEPPKVSNFHRLGHGRSSKRKALHCEVEGELVAAEDCPEANQKPARWVDTPVEQDGAPSPVRGARCVNFKLNILKAGVYSAAAGACRGTSRNPGSQS